jgi:hypothetical protein
MDTCKSALLPRAATGVLLVLLCAPSGASALETPAMPVNPVRSDTAWPATEVPLTKEQCMSLWTAYFDCVASGNPNCVQPDCDPWQ